MKILVLVPIWLIICGGPISSQDRADGDFRYKEVLERAGILQRATFLEELVSSQLHSQSIWPKLSVDQQALAEEMLRKNFSTGAVLEKLALQLKEKVPVQELSDYERFYLDPRVIPIMEKLALSEKPSPNLPKMKTNYVDISASRKEFINWYLEISDFLPLLISFTDECYLATAQLDGRINPDGNNLSLGYRKGFLDQMREYPDVVFMRTSLLLDWELRSETNEELKYFRDNYSDKSSIRILFEIFSNVLVSQYSKTILDIIATI